MKPTYPFACTYEFEGGIWPVIIYAYDYSDAEARCFRLGLTLGSQVREELHAKPSRLVHWTWAILAIAIGWLLHWLFT